MAEGEGRGDDLAERSERGLRGWLVGAEMHLELGGVDYVHLGYFDGDGDAPAAFYVDSVWKWDW